MRLWCSPTYDGCIHFKYETWSSPSYCTSSIMHHCFERRLQDLARDHLNLWPFEETTIFSHIGFFTKYTKIVKRLHTVISDKIDYEPGISMCLRSGTYNIHGTVVLRSAQWGHSGSAIAFVIVWCHRISHDVIFLCTRFWQFAELCVP